MGRNLGFWLALAVMLVSARAAALGLGEITLDSALNQRLVAEIELLETRGLDPEEIIVSLGSREDFERVGVERFFFLTDLRFQVSRGANGSAILSVTSSQPITEPFLNFVVQVLWPNGKLLKEYTLLLDPPTFTDQAAPVVAAPARGDPSGGGPAGRVQRRPTRPDSQVSFQQPARSTPAPSPQDRISADSYGMTDRDDTLWSIASRTRPSNAVSVQQTMLAIERLNPDAFIGGNINLLKAGYRLRLPSEAEITSLTQTEAVAQVAAHNAAWQDYRRGEVLRVPATSADVAVAGPGAQPSGLAGQVDATTETRAAPAAAPGPDGELRIIAGATGDGTAAGPGGEGALEAQLAASEEERDRVTLENEELVYRMDQMNERVDQTQRQLEVRDQQIAQLQAQLAEIQAELQAAAAAPPKQAAASQPGATAVPVWQSPYVLVGGTAVVVSLLAWALVAMRGRRDVEDGAGLFEDEGIRDVAEPMLGEDVAGFEEPEEETYSTFDEMDEESTDDEAPASVTEEIAASSAQTSDVIGEADIYIAYGRYPQAVSLLLGALEEDPSRSEVRLKLLEVFAETKDQDGFNEHMARLVEYCDDDDLLLEARELEARLRDEDSAEEMSAAIASADDDENVGRSDEEGGFSLSLEAEEAASGATTEEEPVSLADLKTENADGGHGDELGGDLGMDFNPEADETVVREQVSESDAGSESELDSDFDLDDLEFEIDSEPGKEADLTVETRSGAEDESEDAFDFLDEEDAATTKLDLARAYIDMGDEDGAREILTEVLSEGSDDQQQQAGELLEKIG